MSAGPAVRSLDQVAGLESSPGVTVREMLNSDHGCRGLHQRRLGFAGGARLAGTAGGRGEAWYVITGTGSLDTERTGSLALAPGTAVWLEPGLGFACRGADLEILAVTVRAGLAVTGPAHPMVRLEDCAPERTGDREFRVLLSEGLTITQFAGMIPPGRAPAHHHTYDEVLGWFHDLGLQPVRDNRARWLDASPAVGLRQKLGRLAWRDWALTVRGLKSA